MSEETERLQKENAILRGLVAQLNSPCVYCGLDNMAECELGFPGCGRADDLLLGQQEGLQEFKGEKLEPLPPAGEEAQP